ncbi:MAG: galactoside O-acetyltransferase [Clostridia bacterium]|nr:galactoside O-acetyltransferase [Clostridia bacterium]
MMVHVLFSLCVIIRNNVQFAPNVSLYTAGHPIHPDSRNSGYEYGIGITLGNPCKVIRKITEEDRKYYYKNYVFDVDDYND